MPLLPVSSRRCNDYDMWGRFPAWLANASEHNIRLIEALADAEMQWRPAQQRKISLATIDDWLWCVQAHANERMLGLRPNDNSMCYIQSGFIHCSIVFILFAEWFIHGFVMIFHRLSKHVPSDSFFNKFFMVYLSFLLIQLNWMIVIFYHIFMEIASWHFLYRLSMWLIYTRIHTYQIKSKHLF